MYLLKPRKLCRFFAVVWIVVEISDMMSLKGFASHMPSADVQAVMPRDDPATKI